MKNKEEYSKKLKEKGYQKFGMLGGRSGGNSRFGTLKDNVTKEEIKNWFTNPEKNEQEIRDFSRLLYIKKGIYNTAVNYYTNLPTLDYNIVPAFYDFSNKSQILKNKQRVLEYCEDIANKTTLRNIVKAVIKDGVYYGYERSGGGTYHLQRLPSDFCREGAIVNGVPSIEFNFSFFDRNEQKLDLYDAEFTTKFRQFQRDKDLEWQALDYDKSICITLESEDFNFPALIGIFDDLIDLEDYYAYMKDSTELNTSKILIQKPPMNKETGEILVDPDDILFFQGAIASVLDERFKIVSTPFEVDNIDFTKGAQGDAGLGGVEKMKSAIWNDTGITKQIFGDAEGSTAQKINYEVNAQFVFAIVDKIELWLSKRLKKIGTRKYPFKVCFMRTTTMYRKELFDMYRALLDVGGSIELLMSSAGTNPEDYKRLLQMEALEGTKDMLELVKTIHTQSKDDEKEAGRESLDIVSDEGDKTRDQDGNTDR